MANSGRAARRWRRLKCAALATLALVAAGIGVQRELDGAQAAGDECFPAGSACFNLDFVGAPPHPTAGVSVPPGTLDSACEPSGLPTEEYCVEEGDPLKFRVGRTGDLSQEAKVRVQLSGGVIGYDYGPTTLSPQPPYPPASENPPPDLPAVQFRPIIVELTFAAGSAIATASDTPVLPAAVGPGIALGGVAAFQTLNCNRVSDAKNLSCAWLSPGTIPATSPQVPGPGFRVTILSVSAGTIGPRSTAPVTVLGSFAPRVEARPNATEWETGIRPQSGGPTPSPLDVTIRGENFPAQGGVCGAAGFPYKPIDTGDADSDGNFSERYDPPPFPNLPPTDRPPNRCLLRVEFWSVFMGLNPVIIDATAFPPGTLTAVGPTEVRVRIPSPAPTGFVDGETYDVRVRLVDPTAPQYPAGYDSTQPDKEPEFSVLSRITPTRVLSDGRLRYDDRFVFTNGATVTDLSARGGPATGGTLVRVFGRNFTPLSCSSNVLFGTTPAASCSFVNSSTLEVTSPPNQPGLVNIRVIDGYPWSPDTPENEFRYTGGPRIDSIDPAVGPLSGGTVVTILGSGFNAGAQIPDCAGQNPSGVKFGGTNALSCTVLSDSVIRAVSPGVVGPMTVQVTVTHPLTGDSQFTSAANFRYSAGPLVQGLNPNYGPPSGGSEVTINGLGFQPGAVVTFGGVTAPFVTYINSGQLRAVAPNSGGRAKVDVIVTVAGQPSLNTPADDFFYSAPKINSITPNAGPTAGGNVVSVKGANFTTATVVKFDGVPSATVVFVNPLELQVTVPARPQQGAVQVKVLTNCIDLDQNGITDNECSTNDPTTDPPYTYTNGPIVTNVNPNVGPITGGTIVVITGTSFPTTPIPTVLFGNTPAVSINVNSATQITAVSPSMGEAGAVDVTVKPAAGLSSPAGPDTKFTYAAAAPVVTGIAPNSVPNSGNVTVTITGMGFQGASCPAGVRFGIIPAISCTVASDTSILAVAPPNVVGETFVTVTTAYGSSEIGNNFTYTRASSGGGGGGGGGGGTPGPDAGGPPPTGQVLQVRLSYRWTLVTWMGVDMPVEQALKGADGVDITATVLAIYRWEAETQTWLGHFPAGDGVPGVNDFTTMRRGLAYWIAVDDPSGVDWAVKDGP